MLRTALTKTTALRPLRVTFTTTARALNEGDTGAPPKTGGQGDAFQRREKANEDYAIRKRELEKLFHLRSRLREQREHILRLERHIDSITGEQGGKQD